MPVLIVPADTEIGVPLAQELRSAGAEVRACVTGAGDVPALRAAGAYVAVGDLDDEGLLDAAMTDVHTVVALHADPLVTDAGALDRDLRTTLTAAHEAGVSRLVVRSVPRPAGGGTDDDLRRVCAGIEQALVELPLPTVAVRTSLVDTPAVRDALVSAMGRLDDEVEVAPVHLDDVVAGLVALDEARGSMVGHATFRVQGPPQPLRDYLELVGDGLVGRRYTPAAEVPLLAAALATAWSEPVDDRTADLLAFADLEARPVVGRGA